VTTAANIPPSNVSASDTSPPFSPRPTYLALEGARNARDIGGYRTAAGEVVRPLTLLRAAKLSGLTHADRLYLSTFPLRTVIDLRQDFEIAEDPDALGGLPVAWHNTPPSRDLAGVPGITLLDLYLGWLDGSGHAFAAAISELGRPGALPALVHCTAGKDRTGLVIAMVLDLLGVDDGTILADYLESNVTLFDGAEPLAHHRVHPEFLIGAFEHVRGRFGSVAEYLRAHGVTAAEVAELRRALLVGP
jgi:protein-tyrosine phosphatase